MTVYVDSIESCRPSLRWPFSSRCRLWADSKEELMDFTTKCLGLRAIYLQSNNGLLHFDLTENMRRNAVRYGAVEMDKYEALLNWAYKQYIPVDESSLRYAREVIDSRARDQASDKKE